MNTRFLDSLMGEMAPAYLQLAITLALVALCAFLNRRYQRRYFGLWSVAWGLYAVGIIALISFSATGARAGLFWHQAATGWTSAAFLWAALVFSQRIEWKGIYAGLVFFPVIWAFLAVYVINDFLWAAGPMVAFLTLTTAAAGWAFLRYDRLVRSGAGRYLAVVFFLWALHHVDYLLFRARGGWGDWGIFVDLSFELAVGLGILLLVLEDLDQGLSSLTQLSGELQGGISGSESTAEAMLRRALSLRGVHGSGLWLATAAGGHFVQGAGVAALWPFEGPPENARRSAERVRAEGTPHVARDTGGEGSGHHAYTAALPVLGDEGVVGALVVVGEARDPFTVLDNRFLLAFGQQVGAALANEELHEDLRTRTEELERLQARMVHQHEEQRARLWRELHDETAQVLAALNLQLGIIAERSDETIGPAVDRARTLLGEGIGSIRRVTRDLRPVALDDLGLVPALRALARDFEDPDSFEVEVSTPDSPPDLTPEAESTLYRTMQEGLSNALRHGPAETVRVQLTADTGSATLAVIDDGPGLPADGVVQVRSRGGLAGIRERAMSLGGHVTVENAADGGVRLEVSVPLRTAIQTEATGADE